MPDRPIRARGGTIRNRTITIGRGASKKTIQIAVVRKAKRTTGRKG